MNMPHLFWLFNTRTIVVWAWLVLPLANVFAVEGRPVAIKDADGGLREGWRQVIEIPAWKSLKGVVILRQSTITLWVEQGWLSVRRNDSEGAVDWQVALAQLVGEKIPVINLTETTGFELSYGEYFLREHMGQFRMFRQKKENDSPPWPQLHLPAEGNDGMAIWPSKAVQLKGWRHEGWHWTVSGLPEGKFDVWLRLEHLQLRDKGYGFIATDGPPRMLSGDKYATDEGDLFVAVRSLSEMAEQVLAHKKLVKHFGEHPAPAIVASQWINTNDEKSLEQLRDKVVLLDFWGNWCGPCVAKLPKVQALHDKYQDRGLIVIGVHSEQGAEKVATFLESHHLSFPIAIDTGDTAEHYGIESWPTYFLIDKSGKSAWGFEHEPPSEELIESLLQK